MKLKTMLSFALALSLIGSAAASAQTPHKAGRTMSAQQQRMVNCNKQAHGKKGAERKAFMKTCLSGNGAATAPASGKRG